MRLWWIVLNFHRLFIPRPGLRLKFQDQCEFVLRFVFGWIGLKGRFTCFIWKGVVEIGSFLYWRTIHTPIQYPECSLCVFILQFGFVPTCGFAGLSVVVIVYGFFFLYNLCTESLYHLFQVVFFFVVYWVRYMPSVCTFCFFFFNLFSFWLKK
jgi:hypothetical protein